MSVKGEKYTSKKAMKQHEATESPAARRKEYGTKTSTPNKAAQKMSEKMKFNVPQTKVAATPKSKPKVTPKATPKSSAKKVNPEKLLQEYLKKGMSLDKARNKVADQTGTWPNGYTN